MAKQSYKELKEELENILNKLQSNDTDLDEVLKLHEQSKKIIAAMEGYLKEVQRKLKSSEE